MVIDGDVDEGYFVGGFDAVQGGEGDVGEVLFGTVGQGGAFAVPGADFDGVGIGRVEGCELGVIVEGRFGADVDFACWFATDGLLRLLRRRDSGARISLRCGALFDLFDNLGNLVFDVLRWAR